MRIRQEDPESRKYEIAKVGFGEIDFIQRSIKPKLAERMEKQSQRR